LLYYPIVAPDTIFLSSSCAVVTSLLTTNAFTGCCVWSDITLANWLVALAPTTLKAGGADGIAGDAPLPPPDPLANDGGVGSFVAVICFTFLKPAAIIAAACTKPNIPPCPKALLAPA